MLALPNQSDDFIVDTDASNLAIGGELIQVQDGEEKVIAYGSYALTPEQRRYCVTRKELLAVVRFCRQYRYYLLGRPFVVRTDHASLTWLLNFREPQGQLARWVEELSQYNMILRHRVAASMPTQMLCLDYTSRNYHATHFPPRCHWRTYHVEGASIVNGHLTTGVPSSEMWTTPYPW